MVPLGAPARSAHLLRVPKGRIQLFALGHAESPKHARLEPLRQKPWLFQAREGRYWWYIYFASWRDHHREESLGVSHVPFQTRNRTRSESYRGIDVSPAQGITFSLEPSKNEIAWPSWEVSALSEPASTECLLCANLLITIFWEKRAQGLL